MFVLFNLHWNMYYHRMWYKKKKMLKMLAMGYDSMTSKQFIYLMQVKPL